MLRIEGYERGLTGWLYNYTARHYWRVASWNEFEDLIQDGMVLILVLHQRYPDATEPGHFMALFKRSFSNHITNLARKRIRLNEVPACELVKENVTDEEYWESVLDGTVYPAGFFGVLVRQAPPEIKALLNAFLTDKGRRQMCALYRFVNGVRETTNQRLCRLAGLDPQRINIIDEVHSYFDTHESYLDSHVASRRMLAQ